ncbi:MAG: rhodanese-like domain-containing protein [Actinomycetota bacterium]
MNPQEVYEQSQTAQLVDVREATELNQGYIDGSVHIPMGQLQQRLGEIDKARPVIAVCHLGHRSGQVAKFLKAQGYDAETLEGGMKAWESERLPISGKPVAPTPNEPAAPSQPFDSQAELSNTIMEVAFAVQEHFGDREPTDDESREFMVGWLISKGKTPEQAQELLS